ncbi:MULTISPECIES: sulfate ABC transporter substrate-binding protein [Modicisalibacter]|uniref:Sulfate ABC transporter substrate-binding protein n=1 Tax=Modicisalibacter tunisiensis TaxID=390637 RepID=A0ABS7WVL5_9GAMM|nr:MULTISPECIES: sulfate ABC transporter substrate-binding protein [Modicisalibacter]MBZ9540352.1 sulfate ABC transporter substrate-binding protein [Modicisalibacter tunisiensis]MBZ9566214.1 sulfate ABC transporter substrate-binding protein [Modicisalibacter tunisiensis]
MLHLSPTIKHWLALGVLGSSILSGSALAKDIELLNVSYDPTRELYKQYNAWFEDYWKEQTGDTLQVKQSHGGSGGQARSIIDGSPADVATLAVSVDIQGIVENSNLIEPGWQSELPYNSAPYTTVQVFLVREGNPKDIHNWDDLVREDVQVITPNPKTSGGARWNFLAAYGWALDQYGSEDKARDYINKLYKNVPVLDSGARGATNTFVQRHIGDVLITYENEALLATEELGPDQFDIVVPKKTVLVETPVAVVDANAKKHGTTKVATAYLEKLFEPKAQKIAAENYYRPRDNDILAEFSDRYADVDTFTVEEKFGSWEKAQAKFFDDGGVFDQIYQPQG